MKTHVRSASLADAGAIAAVHVDAWRWAYAGLMPDGLLAGLTVDARVRQWQEQLAAGSTTVFVAEAEGVVSGFASCGPSRDPEGLGEVYAIYLLQQVQGSGLGRELWLAATDWLRQRGFSRVKVWVLSSNALAKEFYERAGLTADGHAKTSQWGGTSLHEVSYSGPIS